MSHYQSGILQKIPAHGAYLMFDLMPGIDPRPALQGLKELADGDRLVVGLGLSLVKELEAEIDGLKQFPRFEDAVIEVPSTPASLWCWVRGDEAGDVLHRARAVLMTVSLAFTLRGHVTAFRYRTGHDLTGYEDGTENPTGDEAIAAAFVSGKGPGLDGSSFAAVQLWEHDFDAFEELPQDEQDNAMGRRQSDNEELDDAPEKAHVKRTAQESFDPEAFLLRRSMPWGDGEAAGLHFVAFGNSFYAFEAQLKRMVGAEDGITDALFEFTRPVTGNYWWCPPMKDGALDLSAVGV